MSESQRPVGALIEIVERRKAPPDGSTGGEIIVPDEVRINGQALLCPADHPITVHEVKIADGEAVLVTLTVFARRIVVGAESSHPDGAEYRDRLAGLGMLPAEAA